MGAGSPGLVPAAGGRQAPLHFYELQREAKFPQPPNETESKTELIGNRREGETAGKRGGLRRGGNCEHAWHSVGANTCRRPADPTYPCGGVYVLGAQPAQAGPVHVKSPEP